MFRGDSVNLGGISCYYGTVFGEDLSETIGLFDHNFNSIKTFTLLPGGRRIFVDSLYNSRPTTYAKYFGPGELYMEMYGNSVIRQYDFNKKYWISNETAYNKSKSVEKSEIYDTEDSIFLILFKWFLYLGLIALFIILSVNYLMPSLNERIALIFNIGVFIGIIILFLLIDNKYTDWVFLLPLCVCGLLLAISGMVPKRAKRWFTLASIILPVLLAVYQFSFTKTTIRMDNGVELPIKWRPGTDLIKRMVMRNMVLKMKQIENGSQYLSKNELTEYEYSIISGHMMSWITFLRPNTVKNDLSYDEALMFVREMNDIVGYDYFKIPPANIWTKAVSKDDKILINSVEDEAHGINKGVSSTNGYIDLAGNLKEMTSTPLSVPYTNINGIPLKIPDYILAMGSSYVDKMNSYDSSIVPKNWAVSNLGLRLMLDTDIKSRDYKVYGLLVDSIGTKLPLKIELLEINNTGINKPWDMIERELIELSNSDREYTIKTIAGDTLRLKIRENTEPYIFTSEKL